MKRGFTIIEFMIVLSIIGILAAVAIPAFMKYSALSKCKENKSSSACQKALRDYPEAAARWFPSPTPQERKSSGFQVRDGVDLSCVNLCFEKCKDAQPR